MCTLACELLLRAQLPVSQAVDVESHSFAMRVARYALALWSCTQHRIQSKINQTVTKTTYMAQLSTASQSQDAYLCQLELNVGRGIIH